MDSFRAAWDLWQQQAHRFEKMELSERDWAFTIHLPQRPTDALRPLAPVLLPLGILRHLGDPEELARRAERRRRFVEAGPRTFLAPDGTWCSADEWPNTAEAAAEEARRFERAARTARTALAELEEQGWGYDFATGRLTARSGDPGRPAEFFTAAVELVWDDVYGPRHRMQNTKRVRAIIAGHLRPFFPEEDLHIAPRRPIYRALEALRRRAK